MQFNIRIQQRESNGNLSFVEGKVELPDENDSAWTEETTLLALFDIEKAVNGHTKWRAHIDFEPADKAVTWMNVNKPMGVVDAERLRFLGFETHLAAENWLRAVENLLNTLIADGVRKETIATAVDGLKALERLYPEAWRSLANGISINWPVASIDDFDRVSKMQVLTEYIEGDFEAAD